MKTCFYCGEPATHFDENGDGYCRKCWDECEANLAKMERENAIEAVLNCAKAWAVADAGTDVSLYVDAKDALHDAVARLNKAQP